MPTPRRKRRKRATKGTSPPEAKCRAAFEDFTGYPFPSSRPSWLINPETDRQLQLDGYNEELGIAFEYDGKQHRRFFRRYHKTKEDFYAQQRRDRAKDSLCAERGVVLVRIPSTVKDVREHIRVLIEG